jgi:hypothetical protein
MSVGPTVTLAGGGVHRIPIEWILHRRCWACLQEGGHQIGPRHLLKDGDKEANLNLRRMLEKSQKIVKSGCALCF